MSSSSVKLHTQLVKRDEKNAKEENEVVSVITLYERDTDAIKIKLRQLETEFNTEETQYRLVAEDKKEKRLKAGVNIATAGRHEANVTSAIVKRDTKIEELRNKCQKKVKNATAEIKECIDKIATLTEQIADLKEQIEETFPEQLKTAIETVTAAAQGTLDYFQPLVDRCYEEVQAVVNYPPSHFKKQALIKELQVSIQFRTIQLLKLKVAEYQPEERLTQADIDRAKARTQARAEDAQQKADSDARQHEMECQAALLKKAAYAADEQRAKARQAEREEELIMAREADTSDPDAPLPPIESLPKRIFKHTAKVCKPKIEQ